MSILSPFLWLTDMSQVRGGKLQEGRSSSLLIFPSAFLHRAFYIVWNQFFVYGIGINFIQNLESVSTFKNRIYYNIVIISTILRFCSAMHIVVPSLFIFFLFSSLLPSVNHVTKILNGRFQNYFINF